MWDILFKKYEKTDEERKHMPELKEAMTLRVENVRVPLPTAIQRNRNMNPPPVSTTFGTFETNDSLWEALMDGLKPRIVELLDGYALLCRPPLRRVNRLLLIQNFATTANSTGTSSVPYTRRPSAGTTTAQWSATTCKPVSPWSAASMITNIHAHKALNDHACDTPHPHNIAEGIGIIINMDQDVDEPWELHLLDPQGRRHRLTMEPGDMVLYQTDRVAHGHPLPLAGNYYDNVLFRAQAQEVERRSLSSVEAGLGPLEVNELPNSTVAARAAEEGGGFSGEL